MTLQNENTTLLATYAVYAQSERLKYMKKCIEVTKKFKLQTMITCAVTHQN